ncbi:trypsin-like peptidase domain-containing protein [Seohaeicola zhoushanensis]|uniref:Serine protease n=1 Tax=Seohaeicola zhoushanensis TaxID=1569283 RepID=A0A8J3GZK9_9RHOB|nr:trypsin-like peptidase domain-containing protein [Seohaeicola zhoushanensis]GHF63542.1 hypothetical protein GCM10017056_38520 [Seohaeicola zhoushanensis]
MADHFLSKIKVANEDFVTAGGRAALERHDELRALLADRAGPEVAALFAEPLISRGNDAAAPTVSWYTDRAGTARPLSELGPGERERAERWLADHLRPVRALAEDPATAPLAAAALTVSGGADVLVVGDHPVIVNWGLMPGGKGANALSRPTHYAATLGRFLPMSGPAPEPVAAPRATPVAAPVAEPAPRVVHRITPLAWVPLLVLLLLAAGTLAWLLTPGSRLFPSGEPPAVTDAAMLRAAEAETAALRDRKAQLTEALEGAVCRADGQLILPGGLTPEGLLPPAEGTAPPERASAAPDALLPSRPDRVVTGDESLLALIEARTVMVIVQGGSGVTTGSGLSLGSGLIVTNQHVIAAAQAGQILVTGKALARPAPAEVVKTLGPLTEAGGDFALLKIADVAMPGFTLHVPSAPLTLTNVVAAGYPGDVLETDAAFAALKAGDLAAVPGLTVTDGIVNTEQQLAPGTHVLMHSAALSSGNSGGPLVDMCGRLVGVNTFVRQGGMQNRGFALTTADLLAFLQGTGAAPEQDTAACAPQVERAGK